MISKINCSKLMQLMVELSFQASNIINNLYQSQDLLTQTKGEQNGIKDLVTEADLRVQEMIIRNLKKNGYSGLKIIGEEQQEPNQIYEGQLNNEDLINIQFKGANEEIDTEECILFIDPLDGTNSFVSKQVNFVTTLIGLSYQGKALMGLVTQHFNDSLEYSPICYFSHINQNCVYQIKKGSQNIEKIERREKKQNVLIQDMRVILTSSRYDSDMEYILENIMKVAKDQIIRQGGCGKKIMSVILGQGDVYYYHKSGTSRWDIAGPQVLIECLGGKLTDAHGHIIPYIYDKDKVCNDKGLICAFDDIYFQYVVDNHRQFLLYQQHQQQQQNL